MAGPDVQTNASDLALMISISTLGSPTGFHLFDNISLGHQSKVFMVSEWLLIMTTMMKGGGAEARTCGGGEDPYSSWLGQVGVGDIYIRMQCLCVCVSRKMITFLKGPSVCLFVCNSLSSLP